MPLLSFLKRQPERASSGATQAVAVEVLKRQALQRLIGAAILVGLGLVIFPWIFDTKPRPLPADTPIVIAHGDGSVSASNGSAPVVGMPKTTAPTPEADAGPTVAPTAPPVTSPTPPAASAAPAPHALAAPATVPATVAAVEPAASRARSAHEADRPPPAPVTAATTKSQPQAASSASGGASAAEMARLQAALEGHTPPPAAGPAQRFAVQVGAYADNARAHEARLKAEKLGLKTYVQGVDTPAGRRIRIRVGPFASQDEAARALSRLKQAGLSGTLVPL